MSVSKILIDNRDKNYISEEQIQYLLEIEALTVLRKSGLISNEEFDRIRVYIRDKNDKITH